MEKIKGKIGFHESVVPEVLDGKICTWRLRDHKLKVGDIVDFENSQTEELFGMAKITKVIKTTVGKIDLKDKTHYKTYKNRQELIEAFKKHNPNYEINNDTPVYAYTYKFTPSEEVEPKITEYKIKEQYFCTKCNRDVSKEETVSSPETKITDSGKTIVYPSLRHRGCGGEISFKSITKIIYN